LVLEELYTVSSCKSGNGEAENERKSVQLFEEELKAEAIKI